MADEVKEVVEKAVTEEAKPVAEVKSEMKDETLLGETPKEEVKVEVKKDEAKVEAIPEKYEIKLKEGEIDTKTLEALTPTFKELGLTNDKVQKLAEAYAPVVKAQVQANQEKSMQDFKTTVDGWKAETTKMLGAESAKELAFAAKVIDRFGDKVKGADGKEVNQLRQILNDTGMGNHPALVGVLVKVGKLLSEDAFAEPSKQQGRGNVSLYDHPSSVETMAK